MTVTAQSLYTWKTTAGDLFLDDCDNYSNYAFRFQNKNINKSQVGGFSPLPQDLQADRIHTTCSHYVPIIQRGSDGSVLAVIFRRQDDVSNQKSFDCGFEFNGLEKKKFIPFSKTAPDYRYIIQGLNLKGICNHEGCIAMRKIVYIPVGIGSFNIPQEICRAKCPACQTNLDSKDIDNLGFWDCQYTIDGHHTKPNEKSVLLEDRADPEHYTTFDPGDRAEWEYLQVTTEKPPIPMAGCSIL